MKETFEEPLVLYRHHGHGDIYRIHPIVTKYKTEEDFRRAVLYNLKNRPQDALLSGTDVISNGVLPPNQITYLLHQIKTGKYNTPGAYTNVNNLHTA